MIAKIFDTFYEATKCYTFMCNILWISVTGNLQLDVTDTHGTLYVGSELIVIMSAVTMTQ